jgi:uncharacterized SAM-binding protein YcdF (DUF218 family)
MSLLSDLVKTIVPGSVAFLVVGVILGLILLSGARLAAWGRRWLVLLVIGYLALGTPLVSTWLQRGIRPVYARVMQPADAQGARIVVVLGNGIVTYTDGTRMVPSLTRRTAFNAMEGARLYTLLDRPTVVVSGGIVNPDVQLQSEADLLAEHLVRLGVSRDHLRIEANSTNTFEQSERIAAMVGRGARVIVVTTPIHMPRTLELFQSRGLRPIPSPSAIDYAPDTTSRLATLIPNPSSLRASELVFYEYLAIANGWARGWIAPVDAPQ